MKKLIYALFALLVLALAACSSSKAPAEPVVTELAITATDIAYDVNHFEAKVGQPVRMTMNNNGALEHDFSIMHMPITGEVMTMQMEGDHNEGESDSEHDMNMSNMAEMPEIHVAAPIGASETIEFTPSEAGEYEFFCTVPGHKESGMVGILVVK